MMNQSHFFIEGVCTATYSTSGAGVWTVSDESGKNKYSTHYDTGWAKAE